MPPPSPTSPRVREQLLEALAPVVTAAGYDLEDVRVSSAGRRSLVRVVVDKDGGIDLDAVADVSRAVSAALDDDAVAGAVFPGPFVLEVSSPGVDRPLTEARHWCRAVGRLVKVQVDGREVTGRVLGADDSSVRLEVDGDERTVPLSGLGPGRVQVEFGRAEPGDSAEVDDDADIDKDDEDEDGDEHDEDAGEVR